MMGKFGKIEEKEMESRLRTKGKMKRIDLKGENKRACKSICNSRRTKKDGEGKKENQGKRSTAVSLKNTKEDVKK